MRKEKEYNSQADNFSNTIKEKVYNHQTPIDAECWNEIELQIKPSQKKSMWWVSSSIAAAIAIIVLLVVFRTNKNNIINEIKIQEHSDLKLGKDFKTNKKEINDQNFKIDKYADSQPSKQTYKSTTNNNTVQEHEEFVQKTDSNFFNNEDKTFTKVPLGDNSIILLSENERIEDSITVSDNHQEAIAAITNLDDNDIFLVQETSNKKKRWAIAASVGLSGNSPSTQDNGEMLYADASGSLNFTDPEAIRNDGYLDSDISYNTPISVGIVTRKNLNKHIAIETGIVYTYLSTKFSNRYNSADRAKLSLHYLGVPVNMVVYLWNDPKWNIYLTGGGMVEKGIKSVYTSDTYRNKGLISTSSKENIDGVQWSLNASSGISYRFTKNWGIYFEPRLSYYFDNNQPISIRTDKPFVFNLNAGLRYEF